MGARAAAALAATLLVGVTPIPAGAGEPPDCLPEVCDALSGRVRRLPFTLPDPRAFSDAGTVSEALRAAVPGVPPTSLEATTGPSGIPGAGLLALEPSVRRAVETLLAGGGRAETVRRAAAPLDAATAAEAFRLLQHPYVRSVPGETPKPNPRLRAIAERVDLDGLRRSASILGAAVDAALGALGPAPVDGACDGAPTPPNEIQEGIAVDTAGTRTLYTKPYVLTLDLGGCDVYRNLAGGAHGGQNRPLSIAVDLGDDPDVYEQPANTYGLGGASQGVGLLVDAGGDDLYRASSYASMGAGIVGGVGMLVDLAGDDAYEYVGAGGGFGSHGNGTLGLGALLDMGGDDRYLFEFDPGDTSFGSRLLGAQGAGIVVAVGVLADAGGNDRYDAITYGNTVTIEAQGVADFLWGSTGILLDATGNDAYAIEAHVSKPGGRAAGAAEGQGVGVLDGVGVLIDGGGDDGYTLEADATGDLSASAGANGQGFATAVIQFAGIGALLDLSGDDTYASAATATADDPEMTAATSLSQGMGFFIAAGVLADLGGSDTYSQAATAPGGFELSAGQGAGLAAATGVLLDRTGADRYTAGGRSQGYGGGWTFAEDLEVPGGTGTLVDGAGRNAFTGPGHDGFIWFQGVNGVGVGVDGGRLGLTAIDTVDAVLGLFGMERPHAVVTASITSPAGGTALHGDLVMTGIADGGPLALEWVEWRADLRPWGLAERSGGSWTSWRAPVDVDALPDGPHELRARAWAGGLDSAAASAEVVVERWLPAWDVEAGPQDVLLAFDLRTRAGMPVDSGDVVLRVHDAAGSEVAAFAEGLSKGGGRYEATWSPPAAGAYTLSAELPGQLLGETAISLG